MVEIRHKLWGDLLCVVEAENLQGAHLPDAELSWANLRRANLCAANLSRARLSDASLVDALLLRADLRNADLTDAILIGADLRHADLRGAQLVGADLRGANLCGADLRGPGGSQPAGGSLLVRAQLEGAKYDAATRWPLSFNPQRRGCIRVDTEVSPASAPEGRGDEPSPAE